jgi:PAS domain S-box-containing protein
MTPAQGSAEEAAIRHTRAEAIVRGRASQTPENMETLTPEAARLLFHELRVHQLELEMQNEELRRAQEQLEISRERYRDLYDMAPVAYLTLDESGRILEANAPASGLLGAARSELIGQTLAHFIAPEDQDVHYRHRRCLFGMGVPQAWELRLAKRGEDPDPDPSWVRLQAAAPQLLEEEPVCRVALFDVTERNRAEQVLRASEIRHRMMFETSRDALMTLAPPDWRFTSCNSAAIATFAALDEADVLTRPLWGYSPERQPDGSLSVEKARAMIQTAMAEGSHFFMWTFERPSGEKFVATVLLTRMEIEGQPLLQATVRDETKMKRLEAVLGQADRLASMGLLAAGVAHEINNPLVYVLYNVESLSQDLPRVTAAAKRCASALRSAVGDVPFAEILGQDASLLQPSLLDDVVDRAREALAGTQRIKVISKALGTFSRVESVERARVDLNYAIECAITMAFNEIKYRARLVKDLGPLPSVWASEGKLSQVFLNLLINAAHAIDEGKVDSNRITIRSWTEDGDAFVLVEDTGKGIPPANLPHIFEPFFTTKPMGMGSGLGLAICRNIVADFGGDIRVESGVGKGTRFVVRLPVLTDARETALATATTAAARPPTPRGRVLVVDDEELILRTMRRVLGDEHEVVTAASGEKGRAILERDQAFDVILCDLMMPEMTGMDLHEWVSAHHPVLADKVVFVTGGAFTPRALAYLGEVRNLKVDKPIEAAALKRLVYAMIVAARATA